MTVSPKVQIAIANSVDSVVGSRVQILSMQPAQVEHSSLTS